MGPLDRVRRYATDIFAEVDVPALESVAYEDFVGVLPLLGILQRADERITRLSLTDLGKPVDLIRCLKLCPRFVLQLLEDAEKVCCGRN